MRALYVFAITRDRSPAFEWEGHRVECAAVGAAVVFFERTAERPRISEARLRLQHDIVLHIAATVNEVLPVRFGAFVDRAELEAILNTRGEAIQRALNEVSHRVQMTVRVRDGAAHPAETAPALVGTSGTAYLERRRADVRRPMSRAALAVSTLVRHLVVRERFEANGDRPAAIYHLIHRDDVTEYQKLLSTLPAATTTVSGPWPPFAFAPDLWP
jgi:hypothetical protein